MERQPKNEGELFERDSKGRKTDARLWEEMLNGDKERGFDGRDPRALKRRREERGE